MQKKIGISFFLILIVLIFVNADCNNVLERINQQLKGISTIRGNFMEIMKSTMLNQEIKEEGTFIIKKGGFMRFDYKEPEGKWAVSDGAFTYLYDPDQNIVYKNKISEVTDPFFTLFNGGELLKYFICREIEKDKEGDILTLETLDKKFPFTALKLNVTKNGIPSHISYLDGAKNNIDIDLTSVETGKLISGNPFKVYIPKRARVISLE